MRTLKAKETYRKGSYNIDHANRDTSMKFRAPTQFDALKKIGVRPQLKFAPECYF